MLHRVMNNQMTSHNTGIVLLAFLFLLNLLASCSKSSDQNIQFTSGKYRLRSHESELSAQELEKFAIGFHNRTYLKKESPPGVLTEFLFISANGKEYHLVIKRLNNRIQYYWGGEKFSSMELDQLLSEKRKIMGFEKE